MINQYIKNFKSTIYCLFFVAISISTYSAQEIYLSFLEDGMTFVNGKNKIFKKYLGEFIEKTGVNGNIKNWDTFKDALDSDKQKGIAGEVAAKFYFESKGYKILEEHYESRLKKLSGNAVNANMLKKQSCTTKKGPDNGIDGLFILEDESIRNHSEIVINEAKFRNKKNLSSSDFGFVVGGIQQSHSNWNRPRFSQIHCLLGLDYDEETIVRTATLLNEDGILKVYEVSDKPNY